MSDYFKLSPEKILNKHGIQVNNVQKQIIESVDKYKVTVCNCSRRLIPWLSINSFNCWDISSRQSAAKFCY